MTGALVAFAALLGLAIGSFLNVVVWRVPRGESVAHPPSACPRCGHAIRSRDNVPVLSWLILRGRCRDCCNTISVRYPLVEAISTSICCHGGSHGRKRSVKSADRIHAAGSETVVT